MHRLCPLPRTEARTTAAAAAAVALQGRGVPSSEKVYPSREPVSLEAPPEGVLMVHEYNGFHCIAIFVPVGGTSSRNFGLHVLTGISSRARPLAHTRGVRPAVYLLCACCLREMASLVLRVDVRVYTCSKTRNGCWPWPEGVTLAPPKSTWEQPHPGRSRDLKTWVLEMKPGNCTKPGFSTRFSMLRMDPKSPDSGRA